jgi:hypothetical protein
VDNCGKNVTETMENWWKKAGIWWILAQFDSLFHGFLG